MWYNKISKIGDRRISIMSDSRDFKKEYEAFLKKVPYRRQSLTA